MEKCKMYRRGFNFSRIVKRVQTDPVPMDPRFVDAKNCIAIFPIQ